MSLNSIAFLKAVYRKILITKQQGITQISKKCQSKILVIQHAAINSLTAESGQKDSTSPGTGSSWTIIKYPEIIVH
jgi:hypothetical protein